MSAPVVLLGADRAEVRRLLDEGARPLLVVEGDPARRAALAPHDGMTVVGTPAAAWEVVSDWRGDLSGVRLLATADPARDPGLATTLQRALEDALRDAGMRQRTQSERYPVMARTTLGNLRHLAGTAPAVVAGERPWAGRTVFLLAAGPSLDLALPHLGALAERGIVVVVNTAARAACATGARVDVLVALEALSDAVELAGVAEPFGEVVLDVTAGGALFGTGRPTSIFRQEGWMDELLGDVPILTAGTSVAGAAAALARARGAARIVLLGQDLSYPEGRMYAQASGRGDWRAVPDGDTLLLGYPDALLARFEAGGVTRPARRVQRIGLPAWGTAGGTVDSTPDLVGVARWFARFAEKVREDGLPVELVNATGGGAHLAGWEDVALGDFLAEKVSDDDDDRGAAHVLAPLHADGLAATDAPVPTGRATGHDRTPTLATFGAARRAAIVDEVATHLDTLDAAIDACLAETGSFDAVRAALRLLPSVKLLEGAALLAASRTAPGEQIASVLAVVQRGAAVVRGALEG
jgi:hypothetical protein